MNVYDESLLLDNPEYKFTEPMLKRLRGAASPEPPLSRLDDSIHHSSMQPAVRKVWSASTL